MILRHQKHAIVFVFLILCSTHSGKCDFMMKAIMHGAAMGMMMRPRILPIPIPVSTNMMSGISDIFSGFRRQFDSPKVVVIQQQRKPQPKVIIIQNDNHCCDYW